MNTVTEHTASEKILLAAYQLETTGQTPFSAEALVVSAWQQFPQTFGLKNFTELYPDSNKVLASIMGEKGLARKGWLLKMGQKQYALTREGRQVVRRLQHEESAGGAEESVPLSRDQEKFLQPLLDSTALAKFREDRREELNFADACRFWGITENLRGDALDERLRQLQLGLADLDKVVGMGSGTLPNGHCVTGNDLSLLADLHSYLEQRFSRHLNLLRNRSGRA